uniref:Protein kinase domain-containing protein n=1 Tax=Calcidiscus leptoporus TaxID=127549 RepID=A0A7S0IVG7_9EUKA|mmetsp:Transcript_25039/g.58361  ORF Transcript_25039/g.58361 Transcript_25039/m.58361 type:complete len:764 (+) Transcript_25039:550-2841(+)
MQLQAEREAVAAAPISALSAQMADVRAVMEQDEQTKAMMEALRGSNINDDDAALSGTKLKVVEMSVGEGDDTLPLTYEPERLAAYFSKRPLAVLTRIAQVSSTSFSWLLGVLFDTATGKLKPNSEAEVEQVAKLRSVIVSLGPFFIKLGQALSIRPDILSPKAMVELQQLCDKVPSFDTQLAMTTITDELGRSPDEVFSYISPAPVAAASLGQVYKARIRGTEEEVAVKVQRPFVLETVSLDLHLARQLGRLLRATPLSSRLDICELIDEFAPNFYQELDYNLECANGERVRADMKRLPQVIIPKNYAALTTRRVHVAEWVDGEKLSQSTADNVGELVNLGVIVYLTQLLDTGFFHADPHPGNMLRSPDGKLVILDFGLMTTITDNQKYGMIEAIAHLIHRDYARIGDDFVNLEFIPEGVDTSPIVPALARVFDAALAGGGAKSINFQELAADLADITFKFPFRIPPYFALVIRAISVLEGIALKGNPQFAIVDEAYPYISKRLLTDESPRLRAALRYMVYGKTNSFDVDRMIDMLQALEKFVAVKDNGDGTAFKVNGVRGFVDLGSAGSMVGTRQVPPAEVASDESFDIGNLADAADGRRLTEQALSAAEASRAREALQFFFSSEGDLFRAFLLDEVVAAADALSREAAYELASTLSLESLPAPPLIKQLVPALSPPLSTKDQQVVTSIRKLVAFFLGDTQPQQLLSRAASAETLQQIQALLPVIADNRVQMRRFGLQIVGRLAEKQTSRALGFLRTQVAAI